MTSDRGAPPKHRLPPRAPPPTLVVTDESGSRPVSQSQTLHQPPGPDLRPNGVPGSGPHPRDGESGSEDPYLRTALTRRRERLTALRRALCGAALGMALAVCWAGAVHVLKLTRRRTFKAPLFTAWLCSLTNLLFLPVFFLARLASPAQSQPCRKIIADNIQLYQDKGLSLLQLVGRGSVFACLWVLTLYLLIQSLSILDATAALALYATKVTFAYLLSWVILHEQFVGVRIVAVIMCNTGTALLAYMDGAYRSTTLGGVVLASAAAAGAAIHKVMFRRTLGEATCGQVAVFHSLLGLLSALVAWPPVLGLAASGVETVGTPPWPELTVAAGLLLAAALLANLGALLTYDVCLTLGLAAAVFVSGMVDGHVYGVRFEGMKLAGIVLILLGFGLVLLPQDWSNCLAVATLRWRRYHSPPLPPEPVAGRVRSFSIQQSSVH